MLKLKKALKKVIDCAVINNILGVRSLAARRFRASPLGKLSANHNKNGLHLKAYKEERKLSLEIQ